MVSLEDRLKTAVLFEGGLYLRAFPLPETDVRGPLFGGFSGEDGMRSGSPYRDPGL